VKKTQLLTIVGAAVVALAIWVIAVPIAGLDLTVGSGATARTVGPVPVVVVALVAGVLAWALLALLGKRSRHGRRAWRVTAWTLLTLSLLGPVTMGATAGVVVSLVAMHLAVGTTLILGLAPTASDRPAPVEWDVHR
jgi:hypothetical protein